jgi:filamentous hemagglutinin
MKTRLVDVRRTVARPISSSRWRIGLLAAVVTVVFGGPFSSFAQVQPQAGSQARQEQAANGVPVVQIAAPNAAGVSHNQYEQYNVGRQGQVLNNSATTTQTQLAGYIQGNANLQPGQAARLILNEVTSSNRSLLQGHVEVAGAAAQVIIANPNGITCDGCGFINTTRGVLTSGTPLFGGDGSLSAFQVGRGSIRIEGAGLDADNLQRIDLLARAVEINAGLWAKDVNVVVGANHIDYDSLATRAIQGDGAAQGFGLDVAALGGMYAGKIRLVGTEAGVGVRSAGALVATGGDFVLTSAGDVQLTGRTAAAGNIIVDSAGTLAATGATQAGADMRLSGRDVQLVGTAYAAGVLDARASQTLDASGNLLAGRLQLAADGNLRLAGQAESRGDIDLRAGQQLENTGQVIAANQLQARAASIVQQQGARLAAQGALQLQANGHIDSAGVVIGSTGTRIEAGSLANRGQLYGQRDATLAISGRIDNSGLIGAAQTLTVTAGELQQAASAELSAGTDVTLDVTGELANAGQLIAERTLTARADRLTNTGTTAASDTRLTVGALDNRGLVLGSGTLDVDASRRIDNAAAARLRAGQTINLRAAQLDNAGEIISDGDLRIRADTIANRQRLEAAQQLQLDARTLSQTRDGLALGRQLTATTTGQLDNAGRLHATERMTLNAGALDNTGTVYSTRDLRLDSSGTLRNAGIIASDAAVTLRAQALENLANGDISSADLLDIDVLQAASNAGNLYARRALELRAARIDNSGAVYSAGRADLVANDVLTNQGSLVSVQALDVQAASLDSSGDLGSEQSDVRLTTTGDLGLTGKTIAAGQLKAEAGGTLRQSGKAYAATGVTLRAQRDLQLAGNLDSSADITLHAGQALTSDGDVYATGGISADAGTVLRNTGSMQASAVTLESAAVENRGRLLASGNVAVSGDTVDNSGQIVGGLAANGVLGSTGQVTLTANTLLLQSGKVHAGQRVALQASGLDLRNGLVWSGGELVARATGGTLDNSNGTLVATGTLQLETTGELINQGGSLQAARLGILAAALDNRAGELIQTGNDALTLAFSGALRNDGGRIAANATDLTLEVATLLNNGGRIEHAGTGTATVRAGALGNTNGGLIVGNGAVLVDVSGDLTNTTGSQISAGRGADIRARQIDNSGGRIDAVGNLQVRATEALQNVAGTLAQRQAGTLQIQAASVDNRTGLIGAEGNASVITASLGNQGGNLYAKQNLTLDINGDLRNGGGLLYAGGQLQLDAEGVLDNQSGSIEAYAAAGITAGAVDNRSGRLVVDGSNTLTVTTGGALDNSDGVLGSTQGNIALSAATVNNQRGKLVAGQSATLQTTQLDNRSGRVHAGTDLTLDKASATVLNGAGELSAGNLLTLRAASLDNTGGRLITRSSTLYLEALNNGNGEISAYQQLWAQLQTFQGNNGRLFGGADLELHLAGDYLHQNAQQLQSNGRLALNVAGTLTNQGRIETSGTLELNAAQIDNTAAGTISAGNGAGTASATLTASQGINNLGRIDGDRVQTSSNWFTNTGTVMGDQVTLSAGTVTNGRELGSTVPVRDYNEGLLATTGTLAINADVFNNLDGELYSIGDIRIGGRWGGNAQQIVNRSGRIQAERDLVLLALGVRNERRVLQYEQKTYTAEDQAGDPDAGRFDGGGTPYEIYQRYCGNSQSPCFIWRDHGVTNTDTVLQGTRITAFTAAGQFLSGRDMLISGGSVDNIYSSIAAGTNLTINGRGSSNSDNPADWAGVVNNVALTATKTIQRVSEYEVEYQTCRAGLTCHEEPRWANGVLSTTTVTKEVAVPGGNATITAGRNVTIDARDVNNTVVNAGNGGAAADIGGWNGVGAYVPTLGNGSQAGAATGNAGAPDPVTGIATGPAIGTVGGNGQGPNVGAPAPGTSGVVKPPQVVGTAQNPLPGLLAPDSGLYTVNPGNQRWLVETDPRFANYGQWLGSDYMFAKLNLNPDQRLKRLGDDFYEQRLVLEQITGLTGRKYLDADLDNGMDQYRAMMDGGVSEAGRLQLTVGIALSAEQMAALDEDIVWMVAQNVGGQQVLVPVVYLSQATADRLQLGGAAIAGESVDIRANNVNNQGMIAADSRLSIDAGSLLNDRGAVTSGGSLRVSAVEDIINKDGLIQGGNISLVAGRDLQSVASLGVARIESTGDMAMVAGRDLSLVGAQTSAKGNAALVAGRDLNLTTQQSGASGENFNRTTLDVGGSLGLQAGNDLTLTAVQVKAGNNLSVVAGNDINLNALITTQTTASRYGSSTGETLETSGLNAGGNLALEAGQDINLQAADLQAGKSIAAIAGRDLNLDQITTTDSSEEDIRRKRYSKQTEAHNDTSHGTVLQAGEGIALVAGRDATLTAATVYSETGAIGISAARDVTLTTAEETSHYEQDEWSKKKGTFSSKTTTRHDEASITRNVGTVLSGESVNIVAGNNVGIAGSVVAADNDIRIAAGNNVTIESVQDTFSEDHSYSQKKSGFSAGFSGGVASVGYNKSRNNSQSSTDTATQVGSAIGSIDGNVAISAGNQLTIAASDVAAGKDMALAAKDIQLLARQETVDSQSSQSSKSSGFSVGITLDPGAAYRAGRDAETANREDSGSFIGETTRTADGMIAGYRAATTAMVVQAGSHRSNSAENGSTSDARVSQLTAGGNLTLIATDGSITSQGAQMSAEGNAVLAASKDIVFDVAHNTAASGNSSDGKGWGIANNTAHLPVGMHNNKGNGAGVSDTITGTQLSVGGNATLITSLGDINLTGSNIAAEGNVNVHAAGDLTIRSGQDTRTNANQSDNKAIGTVVVSDTERFSGYHTERHRDANDQVTQVASNVASLGGNVSLSAGGTYTQQASNVLAANSVDVVARDIQLLTAENSGSQMSRDDSLKVGVFARVSSPLIDLVNNVDAARQADGRLQNMQALAAVATGWNTYKAVTGGTLASAEAGVGFATSKSQYDANYQTSQGSTISGGGNVSMTSTAGDIHVVQGNLKAGSTLSLDSANNILLEAARNEAAEKARSSYSGAEVGVGASVGAQTGVYVYAQASVGSSRSDGQSSTYQNTQLIADNLQLTSRGDTTLRGASAQANTISADIGGDLNIESLQDRITRESKSSEVGGRVQISFGTAWSAGGSASSSKASSDYTGVNGQSGLFAGDGGFDIRVGGNTDLKGAVIASTADPSKNYLSTGSLTASDLANEASGKASSASYSVSNDMLSGSKYGAAMGIIKNAMGEGSDSEGRSSTTRSDIAAGTVVIGNGDTTALDGMGRTATTPAEALQQIDLQKLQNNAAAEQIGKALVYEQAKKFTDESYRAMFLEEAKVYVVDRDERGNVRRDTEGKPVFRELTGDEKNNLKPGKDGKIHIADNGINNVLEGAEKYANQHSTADGPQYFIHFPKATNGLSELLIAGYQKYMESDLLGLANATELTKQYMLNYGQAGLHLDGHSRGSLTIGNAMESLLNMENPVGRLSGTTVSFLGPAYNAATADHLLAQLQDRKSWEVPQDGVLTLQNHANDLVGRFIGKNPITGGVTPGDSSSLWEKLRVLGGNDTPHNCYGDAPEPCRRLWEGSPGLQSTPIPVNQIDMTNANKFWYEFEKLRGSMK